MLKSIYKIILITLLGLGIYLLYNNYIKDYIRYNIESFKVKNNVIYNYDRNNKMPETYVEKYAMILRIPKINLVYGIYNKDSNLNKLNNGLYLYDTSTMPNKDGVVIIAGHSGSGYLAIFNHLNELEIDDEVSLSYQNQKYDYKVSEIKKLYYKDNPNIMLDRKHRYVLLITCDKNDKKNRLIYICQNK